MGHGKADDYSSSMSSRNASTNTMTDNTSTHNRSWTSRSGTKSNMTSSQIGNQSKQSTPNAVWPLVQPKGDLVYKKLAKCPPGKAIALEQNFVKRNIEHRIAKKGATSPNNERAAMDGKLGKFRSPTTTISCHDIIANAKDIDPNATVIYTDGGVNKQIVMPTNDDGSGLHSYAHQYEHSSTPYGTKTMYHRKIYYQKVPQMTYKMWNQPTNGKIQFEQQAQQKQLDTVTIQPTTGGQQCYDYYYDHRVQSPMRQFYEHKRISISPPPPQQQQLHSSPMIMISGGYPAQDTATTLTTANFHRQPQQKQATTTLLPLFTPQQQFEALRRRMDQINQWIISGGHPKQAPQPPFSPPLPPSPTERNEKRFGSAPTKINNNNKSVQKR